MVLRVARRRKAACRQEEGEEQREVFPLTVACSLGVVAKEQVEVQL